VVGPLGFALLPVGAVALGLYLWRHRTAAEPLVARGVVRGRARTALVVSLLVGAALVAVIVNVPVLARLTLTDSQTVAAFVLVRFLLAVPVGALLGGWSLRRFGDGLVSGAGLLLATVGLFVMSGWGDGSLDGPMATVVLVVVGLGIGLALAPVNNAALADAPAHAHGTASALVVVARMIGMVVGLALLTSIGLSRYFEAVRRLPDPLDTDALIGAGVVQVQTVFLGGGVAALVGAAVAFTLGTRRRATTRTTADAHGVASALVVVARMVGMVVGLALLTAIGLHRYYDTVAGLPDQTDTKALLSAGIVQVQTVFLGAAIAALLGALASIGLGLRRNHEPVDPIQPL
jgi:MFS family permease